MKENKPILFINSATTENIKLKNQTVYDSRVGKKPIKNEEVKEVKKENDYIEEKVEENIQEERVEEEKPVELKEAIEDKHENVEEIEEKKEEEEKPFANKIRLLNRRAELGRYVLVSIKTEENDTEGLFKGKKEKSIILGVGEEEQSIEINDIVDIIILRV